MMEYVAIYDITRMAYVGRFATNEVTAAPSARQLGRWRSNQSSPTLIIQTKSVLCSTQHCCQVIWLL